MEQVLNKILKQSVKHLAALEGRGHIRFKVITAAGLEYGSLEIRPVEKKKKKKPSPYPHGEIRQYLLPMLKDIKPDQVVNIPVGKYDPESIRGNACSWCTTAWGKGTYSSTVPKHKSSVEIYRFPK